MPVATFVTPPPSSKSAFQSAAVTGAVLDSGGAAAQVPGTDIRPTVDAWPTLAKTGVPARLAVPAGATDPARAGPKAAAAGAAAAAAGAAAAELCIAARPTPPDTPLNPKPTAAPV